MKFPYRHYAVEPSPAAPALSVISRPVIPVKFSGPAGDRDCFALLDTGADESYIMQSLAERLGIVVLANVGGSVQTAIGKMSIGYGHVTVEVTDGRETFTRQIVVGIVKEDWSEAILGQIGFLEHFDATFSFADLSVTLVPRSV